MDKATSGNGWAFTPATADKPATWAGQDSIFNYGEHTGGFKLVLMISIPIAIVFLGFAALDTLPRELSDILLPAWLIFSGLGAIIAIWKGLPLMRRLNGQQQRQFLGAQWRLVASHEALTFHGANSWSVALDEVARVESGATVEWQRTRRQRQLIINTPVAIPDAEMQVFIFMNDQRRLVVHTANAAREDCQRLAHSIRSYVEAQRGSPAPARAPVASAPENDGFDL